jgi:hypothetical protein
VGCDDNEGNDYAIWGRDGHTCRKRVCTCHTTVHRRAVRVDPPPTRGLTRLMRRRTQRTFTVITLLIALFFSQLWVAAYACTTTRHSTSTTQTVTAIASDGHADLRDHHTAAVCHAHCDNSAQPDHAEQPAPSPLAWIPLIWGGSTIPELAIQPRLPTQSEPILISAPPPPRILFQVFRT